MGICSSRKNLRNCTVQNTPWLTFEGVKCNCKVLSIYDADTVTIAIPFKGRIYKLKCRLSGIDAAEKRSKNPTEKQIALRGTERLKNLILNRVIWINCGKFDKYGRLLGILYQSKKDCKSGLRKQSINQLLVNEKYAYIYDGGKKRSW